MLAFRRSWVKVLAALPVAALAVGSPVLTSQARAAWSRPNIVLTLTDDQPWNSLWAMPAVERRLMAHGVTFKRAFVVNALCCPSRASILTGQYSHSTGVYGNTGPYGGFRSFHGDGSTIATWLNDAGYRTALVGKYLNEYRGPYIPPGWDHWFAFTGISTGAAYYN